VPFRQPAFGDRRCHAVAERIRSFVAGERLQPGDRLGREEDLAREFGVSRPTLREALRMLSSEHLVRATKGPGGGIFVAATPEQGIELSVNTAVATMLDAHSIGLDELLETRMLLEVPLAGLAAVGESEQDVIVLRALVDEVNEAAADHDRMLEADARLHHLIAQIADNRLAGAFSGWIVDVLQPRLAAVIEPAVVVSVIADSTVICSRRSCGATRVPPSGRCESISCTCATWSTPSSGPDVPAHKLELGSRRRPGAHSPVSASA
jgi:GntR family transcriptional regulator, transcriptional repressor for pyruvate dehydrogenase complex